MSHYHCTHTKGDHSALDNQTDRSPDPFLMPEGRDQGIQTFDCPGPSDFPWFVYCIHLPAAWFVIITISGFDNLFVGNRPKDLGPTSAVHGPRTAVRGPSTHNVGLRTFCLLVVLSHSSGRVTFYQFFANTIISNGLLQLNYVVIVQGAQCPRLIFDRGPFAY